MPLAGHEDVEEDAIRSDKQDADAKEADQEDDLPLPEVLPRVIQPHRRGHVHGLHHPRVTPQSPSTHQDQDIGVLSMSCSPEVVGTYAKRGGPEMRGELRWHRGQNCRPQVCSAPSCGTLISVACEGTGLIP